MTRIDQYNALPWGGRPTLGVLMNKSLKYNVLLARATDYVLMASLASVACGFVILAVIIISRQDAELKSEYSTWESTLVALGKDCDRAIRGGEVFIIKD